MGISRVRMVDFISEESSIAFEKEYIKKGTLLKFYRYEDLLNWRSYILQS